MSSFLFNKTWHREKTNQSRNDSLSPLHVFISRSSLVWFQTTSIFFRLASRRHCQPTITSNRRSTLQECSMIIVQARSNSFLSSSFISFSACAHTHAARLFPLSHPWLMSLVYWAKLKRHCCNRVKLAFVFFPFASSSSFSPNLSLFFPLEKRETTKQNFELSFFSS